MWRRSLLSWSILFMFGCAEDAPVCGNGRVENGEDCDGNWNAPTHPTRSCVALGYNSGTALCAADCRLDLGPCERAGRCGDGQFNEGYEECDFLLSGQIACPAPRFSGGFAQCTPDCRLDTSTCESCGDGVLQPESGELVEVSYEACSTAGWFGGVTTTADCRTASEAFCGSYRLLPHADSLEAPVLRPDGQGGLWLALVTHGKDQPGCAYREPIYHYEPDPDYNNNNFNCKNNLGTLVGYQYSGCARLDLAYLESGREVRWVPMEPEQECRPVELFLLPESLAYLCQRFLSGGGSGDFAFLVTDLQGASQAYFQLGSAVDAHAPVLLPRTSTELELWSFPGVRNLFGSRYHGATGEMEALGTVAMYPGPNGSGILPAAAFFADPLDASDELFQASFGAAPGEPTLVHATHEEGMFLELHRVTLPGAPPVPLVRELDTEGQSVFMVWSTFTETRTGALHTGRWGLDGQLQESLDIPMPSFHRVDFAARHPEGGWMVGGVALLGGPAENNLSPCEPIPGSAYFHFFIGRLSETGELTDTRYFFAPGISFAGAVQFETLPPVSLGPWYVRDGGILYAYGLYDRSSPFCTTGEPVTWNFLVPVHAFGIYVVRLDLPG